MRPRAARQLLTCDGLVQASGAPGPLRLLFRLLLLLRPLAASPAALHLGQALLQGLLQPGQCQCCFLVPQQLQAGVIGCLLGRGVVSHLKSWGKGCQTRSGGGKKGRGVGLIWGLDSRSQFALGNTVWASESKC